MTQPNRKQRRRQNKKKPSPTPGYTTRATRPAPPKAQPVQRTDLTIARDHFLDPAARLEAIRRLRRTLDNTERDIVETARIGGASWGDVAGWLGVTRQSAHERFSRPQRP